MQSQHHDAYQYHHAAHKSHPQAVKSLLDEEFANILVNIAQQQQHDVGANSSQRNSSAEQPIGSLSSSGFSSLSTTDRNETQPRSSSCVVNGDNSYILDLSKPGESLTTRSQNRLEVIRSDLNNHHLPTCVRSNNSSRTSTDFRKQKATSKLKQPHDKTCQKKCCRPLYIIPPNNQSVMENEDNSTNCKHRQHNRHISDLGPSHREHFDEINKLRISGSNAVTPRESGATSSAESSTCDISSSSRHPHDHRCPDCGRCRCARCIEELPVTCCGGKASDDCFVDVLTCMCCVKGISSFFTNSRSNPSSTRNQRQRRKISQLPTPTGSITPNKGGFESYIDSSDDSDIEDGCLGLASSNPCSCRGSARQRTLRFAFLSLLTCFLPCLACYLPCRAAGRSVRWCHNRSRAPEACRCPRPSGHELSSGSSSKRPSSNNPRFSTGSGQPRPQRSQTAPSSALRRPEQIISGAAHVARTSDSRVITGISSTENSRHAKRW